MKQISLATTGYELIIKRTCKRVFLEEMELVTPWRELVGQPHASAEPTNKGGRPAFGVETMLRIHFLQQWFGLSDPAMEEALHDIVIYCQFAQLDPGATRLPDETTILRFRHIHRLEANNLSLQIMATINATLAVKCIPYTPQRATSMMSAKPAKYCTDKRRAFMATQATVQRTQHR